MKKIIKVFMLLYITIFCIGCGNIKDTDIKSLNNVEIKLCDYKNIDISNIDENLTEYEYIAKYLLNNCEVIEYPKEEVEDYLTELDAYYIEYASYLGVDYDTYIKDYLEKTKEEFENESRESAIEYVKTKYILLEIAKKENISLSDEDYDNYLNDLLPQTNYNSLENFKNNIISENEEESMKESALFDKIIKYVVLENK